MQSKSIFLVVAIIAVATTTVVPHQAYARPAEYLAGFNQGKLDRQNGTTEPATDGCDSMDFHGMIIAL